MIIQNNLNALNAHNRLKVNIAGAKKVSEQLSSGFRINRAADDPAGLAISEKMRAQIRGLNQAIRNANDGISLIQTAEGALDETHAMCKRLKELSVQMANGTYTDEERKYAQEEVDQIIEEINRIAKATDFNGIKLLDGSLAGNETGSNGSYGASYGVREFSAAFNQYISVAANNSGVSINFTTNASGTGGETAHWDLTGKTLTINLADGGVYTDAQINALIQKAAVAEVNQTPPAKVEFKSEHGFIAAANYTTAKTVAGAMQTATLDILPLMLDGGILGFADKITFTANQYGSHATTSGVFSSITISTTNVKPGEERVTVDTPAVTGVSGAAITLHLSTGVEYTAYSIENLLLKAGFDYSVDMFSTINPSGDNTIKFVKQGSVPIIVSVGTETGPPTPPTIANNDIIGWTDITRTLITSGADGVAAVYKFENAITILNSYVGTSVTTNGGKSFNIVGETINIESIGGYVRFRYGLMSTLDFGFYLSFVDSFGVTQPGVLSDTNPHWVLTWVGNDIIATAKTTGAVGGVGGGTSGSIVDGQGLGRGVFANGRNGLILQIGANNATEQRVMVNINAMDSESIGLSGFNVSTIENAQNSIDKVDGAIRAVSRQRASLGAMQNRLEHTTNSLTIQVENLTAAESRIRDVDMAQAMIEYTKYNILQQSAQAMLAQANQAPQAILQLLR